jgi:hypothetical protein
MEDFISTNNIELLYESEDTLMYLHYNGTTTNSDLTMASSDIVELVSRKIIDDSGCRHRMIVTVINFKTDPRMFNNKHGTSKRLNGINIENSIRKFHMLSLIFRMKLLIITVRNFANSFFVLQSSIFLRVKF